jgi:flagellar basal-body rod modification protein FlgD
MLTLNASNYIGKTVEAKADTATLQNGQVSFGYSLNSAASSVTLTVSDSSGNAVWSGSGTTTAGSNSFTWDGKTTDGTQLSNGGQYSLSIAATDSSGNSVYGYTTISGTVTGVDSSSGTAKLTIGNTSVSTSNVIGVTS